MKVLVEEMRCGLTPTGEGVVTLYGLDLQLTMIVPGSTAVKIAEARDPRLRVAWGVWGSVSQVGTGYIDQVGHVGYLGYVGCLGHRLSGPDGPNILRGGRAS